MKLNTALSVATVSLMLFSSSCSRPIEQSQNEKQLQETRELINSALEAKPDFQRLSSIPPEKREYILALLALFHPQVALNYLHAQPNLSKKEAQIAVSALRIQSQDGVAISKEEASWIYPSSPFEKDIQATTFPNAKEPLPQFREEAKVLVVKTRKLRGELNSAIADLPPIIQLRLMEADRELELKTGKFVRTSPIPHGIPKKLVNYKQGLISISQEYFDRAGEIAKLEIPIQENLKREQAAAEKDPILPPRPDMGPDFKKWPWPQGFLSGERGFEPLNITFLEKNYLAALILADSLRSKLLKDDADYYSLRAGLLLLHSSDDSMRRYVFEELSKARQDALLLKWKELL
jgi:hypothetical protein